MDFTNVKKNLEARGFIVSVFETAAQAAAYLNGQIDGMTVGFGGSATLQDMGLFELLESHNTVRWHWVQEPDAARRAAMNTQVYISSVNALAETGEMVNIDGCGNRVASTLFGHEKLYLVVGENKLAEDYEKAVWRARNIAAPRRAQQLGKKTPCAVSADHCYDCKSPDRICRGMVTLWGPMLGMPTEVILIGESLGL